MRLLRILLLLFILFVTYDFFILKSGIFNKHIHWTMNKIKSSFIFQKISKKSSNVEKIVTKIEEISQNNKKNDILYHQVCFIKNENLYIKNTTLNNDTKVKIGDVCIGEKGCFIGSVSRITKEYIIIKIAPFLYIPFISEKNNIEGCIEKGIVKSFFNQKIDDKELLIAYVFEQLPVGFYDMESKRIIFIENLGTIKKIAIISRKKIKKNDEYEKKQKNIE